MAVCLNQLHDVAVGIVGDGCNCAVGINRRGNTTQLIVGVAGGVAFGISDGKQIAVRIIDSGSFSAQSISDYGNITADIVLKCGRI